MEQYEHIAKEYHQTEQAIAKRYSYGPTLVKLCSSLHDSIVIDAGCGTGYSTRILKHFCHPKAIYGIDSSKKEIEIAKQIEELHSWDIQYCTGKIETFDFDSLPAADVITALFLLHYSPTKKHMLQVCKSIYAALPSKGIFVTVNSHPDFPIMRHPKYEVTSKIQSPYTEGAIREVTYWQNQQKLCSFQNYYWSKETYKKILLQAGFKKVEFLSPIVSSEGYKIFGKAFWKQYLAEPHVIGIKCSK